MCTRPHMNYDLSRASVRKLWSLLTASINAFKSFWRLHTKSNRSRGNLEGRRVTGIVPLFSYILRPDKWAYSLIAVILLESSHQLVARGVEDILSSRENYIVLTEEGDICIVMEKHIMVVLHMFCLHRLIPKFITDGSRAVTRQTNRM